MLTNFEKDWIKANSKDLPRLPNIEPNWDLFKENLDNFNKKYEEIVFPPNLGIPTDRPTFALYWDFFIKRFRYLPFSELLRFWLEQDEKRKKGLPHWEEFLVFLDNYQNGYSINDEDIAELKKMVDEYGDIWPYFETIKEFFKETDSFDYFYKFDLFRDYISKFLLEKELRELRTILNQLKSELQDKQGQEKELKDKLAKEQNRSQELENKLTAITLSADLLTTQISNLENEKQTIQQRISNYEKEIQELLKNKAHLEIENEKLAKNNGELKLQLNQQKDKISRLEGDIHSLQQDLDGLETELEIVPETEENKNPEQKSFTQKIKFFEDFFKRTKKEKEELKTKLQKEEKISQEIRQSLTDLEERLKNSGEDNLSQLQKLDKENKEVKKKMINLELNCQTEKKKVQELADELETKKKEAEQLGITLNLQKKETLEIREKNKWLTYGLWGLVVAVVLVIVWFVWRKFFFK